MEKRGEKTVTAVYIFLGFLTVFAIGYLVESFKSYRRFQARAVKVLFFEADGKLITFMQMKDSQTLTVSIAAQDAKGNPTKFADGAAPAWDVSDAALATVAPAADGMSAVVTPVGPLGDFSVQVSIPAAGSEPALQGSLDVSVVAGDASTITLSGVAQ